MKDLMTGNGAVVSGVVLCRPKIISAFPITPQTTIVEELSKRVADGKLDANFITMEGEHSSLACAAAACSTGVRVFLATSSHGLAYMNEMLCWVAGARLPIVMVNVNRIIGAPWSIGSDQTDSLMARDVGWIQIYCSTAQEALDTVIQAYRLAEQLQNPVMVCYDGFLISHTVEVVDLPDQDQVDTFLPPLTMPYILDHRDPHTFHISVTASSGVMSQLRKKSHDAVINAAEVLKDIDSEYYEVFGRKYGLVETYKNDDAEISLLAVSSMAGTARVAVDELRKKGRAVGLVRQRLFRPTPIESLKIALQDKTKIIVLNRNLSPGVGGFFSQELRAGFYGLPNSPEIVDVVLGIGGEDIQVDTIVELAEEIMDHTKVTEPVWVMN